MPSSSRRRSPYFASVPVFLALVTGAACSSSSGGASSPDASFGDGDTADGGTKHTPDGGKKTGDAAHDGKTTTTGDGAPGCGLCDSGKGADGSGDDAGHDSGHTVIAPLGGHTAGVPITVTTQTGQVTRTYSITVPADCDASHPLPIVFYFHGDGGNGEGMYDGQYGGQALEQAAAAAGGEAIFVYPDGLNEFQADPSDSLHAWDVYHDPGYFPYPYTAGQPMPAEDDEASGNGDLDFFDAMLLTFKANYCVDTSKVFLTGSSAGGYAANQFARWRSDVVKGTAPQSGGAPFGNPDGDTGGPDGSDYAPPNYCVGPTGAVPIIIFHGAADGEVDPSNATAAEAYWQATNGCPNAAANNCSNGSLVANGATTSTTPDPCITSTGCGAPVVLCMIPGLGHENWMGAPAAMWSFFASL
jgi:polyhydroxybutyrate depolymerase